MNTTPKLVPATPTDPDDRANVVIRIPRRELERLKRWMDAGHVVSELHISGQPPIDCDVEEAWVDA